MVGITGHSRQIYHSQPFGCRLCTLAGLAQRLAVPRNFERYGGFKRFWRCLEMREIKAQWAQTWCVQHNLERSLAVAVGPLRS